MIFNYEIMKWTNLVHVLIEKVEALIHGISQLVLIAQVLVKLLERHSKEELLSFGEGEKRNHEEHLNDRPPLRGSGKRRTIHIRDLVLAEGDWLMDTIEVLDVLKVTRGTFVSHRDEGLLTDVRIGAKGGGVRFISSEVFKLREWYSVRKGKV